MAYEPRHVAQIILHVMDRCAHPQAALRVWSVLQLDAGPQQMAVFDRDELAARANISAGSVSRVVAELESMGALERALQSTPRRGRGRGPITVRMKRFW